MIMPISAVPANARPDFRGKIKPTSALNEAIEKFTVSEKRRWNEVLPLVENSKDNRLFEVFQDIKKIGQTILKSIVIKENGNILNEDIYNIQKSGTLLLYSRESMARTIIETFENIYKNQK